MLHSSDRWKQIEDLFHESLQLPHESRAALLDERCRTDAALKKEVQTLLQYAGETIDSLEQSVSDAANDLVTRCAEDTITPGTQIDHYRIISLLGSGGMGQVYLAEDTELRRKVAIKMLSASRIHDEGGLRRFEREARAASALNHPNILTIYEFGQADGLCFIVSEYLEGETLRQELSGGGLEVKRAVDISIQIAKALDAAHSSGIVHRDIKPENIIIRADGLVKVLDFGIAKLSEANTQQAPDAASRALTLSISQVGQVIGSARYMSPEQARGQMVDARSDIFSLGVVMYEMIAGRAPFDGETVSDVIAEVLKGTPPDLGTLVMDLPLELREIIERALSKDRELRYPNVREMLCELQNLESEIEFRAKFQKMVPGNGRKRPARQTGSDERIALRGSDGSIVARHRLSRTRKVGIPVLVLVFVVFGVGYARWLLRESGTNAEGQPRSLAILPSTSPSVAVLPFADLSPGKDQEYFSDGLADELINDLAKVPGVRVVARSSAFQFKGKNEDVRSVGRQLGVANILEGSSRREGNRVRIMAELIKVADGFQLWSATYDRTMEDVFNVQDEIARSATAAMQVKLLGANVGVAIPNERPPKSESYQAYLQAQAFFGSGEDKGNLERARASADEAIKFDPDYAQAWALRSYVWNVMAAYSMTDMEEGTARARQDAERAIALSPRLAAGYLALGWIQLMHDWDWEQAEASLNKAAQLEPGSIEVLRYRSSLLRTLGRLGEAIEIYQEVLASDPLRARSYASMGAQLYCAGRYEEATAMFQKALELNPNKENDHLIRGQILLAQGRPQQGLTEIEQEIAGDRKLFGEALAYHSLGRTQDSDAALQQLIATRQQDSAFQIAEIYAFRGQPDEAFDWLERAYRQRDGGLMFLKIVPLLKGLRQDRRYADLLKRMRLPT